MCIRDRTDPDLLGYAGVTRAWEMSDTVLPAGYTQNPKYQGGWALRTGIAAGGANVYSYSSANQRISIQANATSAELTFHRYPILGDAEAVGKDQVEAANLLEAGPEVADYQYLLALFDDGSYQMLRTWRSNEMCIRDSANAERPDQRQHRASLDANLHLECCSGRGQLRHPGCL